MEKKYIIKMVWKDKTFYIIDRSLEYCGMSFDRMISYYLQLKCSKYRTTLQSYGGKIYEDRMVTSVIPSIEFLNHWQQRELFSDKWMKDTRLIYFDTKEEAQNAVDWIESLMVAKTLFKK